MKRRGQGTLIFTPATASFRDNPGYAAFSGAKHALRTLKQSCARELGPHNIHVSHVIIYGGIDGKVIQSISPNVDTLRKENKILNPDHIAQNYVRLYKQPRESWTFGLDLRPYSETW